MNSAEYKITKDFGSKTLQDVFVKREDAVSTDSFDIKDAMKSSIETAEAVCVYGDLSQGLVDMLTAARGSVYVIVPKIDEARLFALKGRAIVRECAQVQGRFVICDKTAAFFFGANLDGCALHRAESVEKMYDYFIWNFWNNTTREYIVSVTNADKTFDVPPPIDSADGAFCYSKSADEVSPCMKKIMATDTIACANAVQGNAQTIIATQDTYKRNKGIMAQGRHFVLADRVPLPMIQSGGKWFVTNYDGGDEADNSGKYFAVEMEGAPVFANEYDFHREYTYRDSVGRAILNTDFKDITIAAQDNEVREISCDKRQWRAYKRMNAETLEEAFETYRTGNLLTSGKLAAVVDFTVTVNVLKLSRGAKPAEVYDEYAKAENALNGFIDKEEKEAKKLAFAIEDAKKAIHKNSEEAKDIEKKIDTIECEIANMESTIAGIKQEIQQCAEGVKKCEDEAKLCGEDKAKSDAIKKRSGSLDKRSGELKKQLSKSEAEHSKAQKSKEVLAKELKQVQSSGARKEAEKAALQKSLDTVNSIIDKARTVKTPFHTVDECKGAISLFGAAGFSMDFPRYDLPKYGQLYKTKDGYEYAISDDDIDAAQSEAENNGISNVKFVEKANG